VSEPQQFSRDARVDPPLHGDEVTVLRSFLTYHRDTLRWKCSGLTQEQLAQPLAPTDMTLGGLMKHMAIVEAYWFDVILADRGYVAPFDGDDVDDPEWEWVTARDDTPAQLRAWFDEAVVRADAFTDEALARDGLDAESVGKSRRLGTTFTLRWILVHMIEEYARHNGHADLIRESIDGQKGD
jgi:uncharacterized damage-inducible protein DinB